MAVLSSLPRDHAVFMRWSWPDFEPYVEDLLHRDLTAESVGGFLTDWSELHDRLSETFLRHYIAISCDTADPQATEEYHRFLDEVFPPAQEADQRLREKLLASGLEPEEFAIALGKMRATVALFRPENLPLLSTERKLGETYARIVGAQVVQWNGEEINLPQLQPALQDTDRSVRERAWRLAMERRLEDREALNDLWAESVRLRRRLAANAGLPDYRAYRWRQLQRLDYGPADCERFAEAIGEIVVPAASRVLEKRRKRLGVDSLRPWDWEVDTLDRPPLHPFTTIEHLVKGAAALFRLVDRDLGESFDMMVQDGMLDLESRKNKAPGGFCDELRVARRPFIFMNAVGVRDDVQTLLHEGGHAFHAFESDHWRWQQQRDVGLEFAEMASMAMELLASPYLADEEAGFYDVPEAARARIEHLEQTILFWPYMAVVDAFQHWAHGHSREAEDHRACDATWVSLYRQYRPQEDWHGLEDALATGWQRKVHIFSDPFYYVEYGLAQLGAAQVWANARRNQHDAVARYRHALSLGGTRSIPELYAAAGVRFAFDAATLQESVSLIEDSIAQLEGDEWTK